MASTIGAGSAGVVFFVEVVWCGGLKSLGLLKFETYEFERFYEKCDSIYLPGEGLVPFFVDGLDCFS
jgi:hypothetical protein